MPGKKALKILRTEHFPQLQQSKQRCLKLSEDVET